MQNGWDFLFWFQNDYFLSFMLLTLIGYLGNTHDIGFNEFFKCIRKAGGNLRKFHFFKLHNKPLFCKIQKMFCFS